MNIRSAMVQDETAVVALWQACGLAAPYNDPTTDFQFALGKPSSDILVADDKGVCGAIMVGHDGHRGWLYYVAVDPARRKRGIGSALVRAAEQWLKERDVPKVHLMVRETNEAVTAFYRRIGYDLMPRTNMQKWLKS
ncbi:MAG TPA: GNAT family acetyltransferase [Rhizomicrobium sp.]|nr:GNAT family acetyltransferase [Rhizomicrobium sp.]